MKRCPIWINGELSMAQVAQIFRDAGWHMHCRNGLMVVDPVPGVVRKDPPRTNVLPLRRTPAVKS
ncbi:MAG TPA: hypothetical protein VLH12_08440 [Usitatibacter sp.]|nr:hypothetical protein [Usitatibacter sp.]